VVLRNLIKRTQASGGLRLPYGVNVWRNFGVVFLGGKRGWWVRKKAGKTNRALNVLVVIFFQIFECFFSIFFGKYWQDLNFVVLFVAAKKPVAHWWLNMLLFTASAW